MSTLDVDELYDLAVKERDFARAADLQDEQATRWLSFTENLVSITAAYLDEPPPTGEIRGHGMKFLEELQQQRREMGAATDALDDPSDAEIRL